MTSIKTNKVLKGLLKKGFYISQGDHKHLVLQVDGRKTKIRTKVSHGSKEISGHLINLMSIQIKLEIKQFIDLVNCPLSGKGYLQELQKQGIVFK